MNFVCVDVCLSVCPSHYEDAAPYTLWYIRSIPELRQLGVNRDKATQTRQIGGNGNASDAPAAFQSILSAD